VTHPVTVSDSLSNANEQIEQAAKAVGRSSHKQDVFAAIYYHKAKARSVSEVMKATQLKRMQVLKAAGELCNKQIAKKTTKHGEIAYEKVKFFHVNKKKILAYAKNLKSLVKLPTKRRPAIKLPRTVSVPTKIADVLRITIDDVASFARVAKVRGDGHLPATVSEAAFKKGIEKIVRELGGKKDWGGERNDLHTTRLKLKTKRVGAAFAFKGPGKKAKTLTPGMMGKNGDQIQRLFQTDAEVFFVQYWRDIGEAVLEQMRTFAVVKSIADGNRVHYGAIDGTDSYRLVRAYPKQFSNTSRKQFPPG
jgi:hypothetical protein